MLLLKKLDVSPPDQFHYVNPDTGWLNRQVAYDEWVRKEKEHRKANNLPIPDDLEAQMQDQLCKTIGPEWCEYEKEDGGWVDLRLSLSDVIDFTKVLLAHAKEGGQYVDQAEAERRASICSKCYYQANIMGCGACKSLADLVVSGHSTSFDSELKSCGVCHCFNTAQVHFPLDVLEVNDTEERQQLYPKEFCWKSKQSENYRG